MRSRDEDDDDGEGAKAEAATRQEDTRRVLTFILPIGDLTFGSIYIMNTNLC